jgi:hypothetical protein
MGNAKEIDMANLSGFAKVFEKTEPIAGIRLIITPVGDAYDMDFTVKGRARYLYNGLLAAARHEPEPKAAIIKAAEILKAVK